MATNEIAGNLNQTLIKLQDIYQELDNNNRLASVANNPFEDNPYSDTKGLTGIAKELEAKTEFIKSCF